MKQLETFGARVEDARIEARRWLGHVMTQVELASLLEIAPQTISQWEAGAAPRSLDTIEKVAEALRVTPGWLAFGQEPRDAARRKPYDKLDAGRGGAGQTKGRRA